MMKRLFCLMGALLLCLPFSGLSESVRDYYGMYQTAKEQGDEAAMAQIRAEMPSRLFPARDGETGLMGYINFLGEWAIPPRFAYAEDFRGNYAAVTVPCDDPKDYYHDGIIDREGRFVLEPRYTVDSGYDGWTYGGLNRGMYLIWDGETKNPETGFSLFGYFDVPSGCFSDLKFPYDMRFWNDAWLEPAYIGGRPCYIDRGTGEALFFLPEDTLLDTVYAESEFRCGWAVLENETGRRFLVNERGDRVYPAEDLEFSYADNNLGLVLMLKTETVRNYFMTATSKRYGYYDPARQDWLLEPQFEEAYPFSGEGYACVKFGEGNYGHIDTNGSVVASGFPEPYGFLGAYAYLSESNVLINAAGETVLSFPQGYELMSQGDDELDDAKDYYVSPDGLMELLTPEHRVCVMNLAGEWILPPDSPLGGYSGMEPTYEWHRFFSCGLYPVQRLADAEQIATASGGGRTWAILEGAVGYINTRGELVVDCVYDFGSVFLDGLAYVTRNGQAGYIDAYGHEICFWNIQGE